MSDQPLVTKEGTRSNTSEANATVHDRTGLYLAILAFGLSLLALDRSWLAASQEKLDTAKSQLEAKAEADAKVQQSRIDDLAHRVEVAENHWRNGDTAILNLQSSVRKLETSHARN